MDQIDPTTRQKLCSYDYKEMEGVVQVSGAYYYIHIEYYYSLNTLLLLLFLYSSSLETVKVALSSKHAVENIFLQTIKSNIK